MEIPKGQYFKNLLIAIDQLINALFGGYCDETMSSRAWRWYEKGIKKWPCILIDHLFFWESCHCYESYLSELERKQLPPDFRY